MLEMASKGKYANMEITDNVTTRLSSLALERSSL